ncbi:MAG: Gfo/Idh/MocA family oxidoreductase [Abditibacteriaceae bacterium]
MSDKKLQVAVIGCGGIGNTHARVYKANDKVDFKAVCDLDKERADATAATFGVKAYYSVDELLKNEDLDSVSVATAGKDNGGHHHEPTIQALNAGKHVLCEKPISDSLEHAREMVQLAEDKKLFLGTNLNHRSTPAAQQLKELQDAGELGDVLIINMSLWIDNKNESSPWFHIRALHQHSIDVIRFFGGDVKKVQCFMHAAPGREIWSNLSMNLQFANGAVGHLTGSYDASMLHPIERCEVMGTKGRGVIDNVFEKLTFYPREDKCEKVWNNGIFGGMASFGETFDRRINRWVDDVLAGGPISASGADGLAAQEIVEAAIRSFENNTVETL